jgi:hypothetical protein
VFIGAANATLQVKIILILDCRIYKVAVSELARPYVLIEKEFR